MACMWVFYEDGGYLLVSADGLLIPPDNEGVTFR